MATIRDIAKKADVSVGTVSNYLNNSDKLAEKTRVRIADAIKELGYYPNVAARSLKSNLTRRIGIVPLVYSDEEYTTNASDAAFQEFLSAVNMASAKHNYSLLMHASVDEKDEIEIYRQMVGQGQIDGMIILGTMPEDERVKFLMEKKFPFVSYGRTDIKDHNSWVDVDGAFGMKSAVQLLADLGHTKIAWAAPTAALSCYWDRLQGYTQGLKENNIPLRKNYIIKSGFREKDGQIAMHQLLDSVEPPTAIIMANDLASFGAMSAISKRGLEVGKDVSVVGFDDIIASEHWTPSLTTVRQPNRRVGIKTIEMLIDIIGTKEVQGYIYKPEVVRRASVGQCKI